MREMNMINVLDILELFCELLNVRLQQIDASKYDTRTSLFLVKTSLNISSHDLNWYSPQGLPKRLARGRRYGYVRCRPSDRLA